MVLDRLLTEMGRTVVEALTHMEREKLADPDYHPLDLRVQK